MKTILFWNENPSIFIKLNNWFIKFPLAGLFGEVNLYVICQSENEKGSVLHRVAGLRWSVLVWRCNFTAFSYNFNSTVTILVLRDPHDMSEVLFNTQRCFSDLLVLTNWLLCIYQMAPWIILGSVTCKYVVRGVPFSSVLAYQFSKLKQICKIQTKWSISM